MAERSVARDRDRPRNRAPDGERAREERRPRRRQPAPGRAGEPAREQAGAQPLADGQADGLPAAAAAEAGLRQIAALTGKTPEGVTGVAPAGDGWLVSVEVVEDRRVPSSADILALYEAELDPDGTLLAYRRARRYLRNRSGDDREVP